MPQLKRFYLSGPMTGHPDLNFPAFNAEAARLRALGLDVVNPAEFNMEGRSWADCMKVDIAAMLHCTAIHMLPGWEQSRGARLEHMIACSLGFEVTFAEHAGQGEVVA